MCDAGKCNGMVVCQQDGLLGNQRLRPMKTFASNNGVLEMLSRFLFASCGAIYFAILIPSTLIPSTLCAQTLFPQLGEPLVRRSIASVVDERSGEEAGWASEEIETDRDSFTPATTLAGRKRMILESAYSFIDNRRVPDTHSYPELLLRYGLTDRVELRFGTNYEVGGAGNPISANVPDELAEETTIEEETNISYGAKIGVTKQAGWLPQSVFIVTGSSPVQGNATDSHLGLAYASGWTFANRWMWDNSMRYSTGTLEDDHFNVWSPSTVLKIPLGERWKGHVEYFGVFSQGKTHETVQQFVSPGLHFLFTKNVEFGTRLGWGMNDQTPNSFINIGGGVRF